MRGVRSQQGTSSGVRQIVMPTGGVVDTVFAGSRGSAFKAGQLSDQPGLVEQFNTLAIQQRQHIAVQIRLGLLR